jgi:tRNA nucleotidyltransferase/poly(A) polymerase
VDVAELEGGSIGVDLRRRDFTVNAVAISLRDGSVLDPFGGLADLARGRLRPVRSENLVEDPLRAVRAARLLATHGLVPDPQTLAAAKAAAPGLSRTAAERIGAELARILGSPRASGAIGWAARAGLLPAMLGLPLDSDGVRRAVSVLRRLDDPGTVRLRDETRRRLRLASLGLGLDLGGPGTRRWLAGRRLPRREVEDAARTVELLDSFPRKTAGKDAWRWIVRAGPLLDETLHIVSRLGRRSRDRGAELRRLARRRRRPIAVSGRDVMGWLGLAPGPRVGALLAELEVAVACGQVKNRAEARNWLTGQVREASSAL